MRNLKKVLTLVLALVMSLSLVTIANAADFSDDADIDYDEAVDVMVAAGIIDGVGNNSFDPNGTLTREQAAKLITYMLLGENSDKLGVESTSFKDVAATRWSAPAIEYCATMGIIDGAGDGNFYPAGKLTGYAFAKMLLTAIGYNSQTEKFVGTGWTINVATKAISEDVRLDRGLETMFGSAELSRQDAAQMALNAIKAPLVEYDTSNTINVNGVQVDINGGGAKFVTTTLAREQRISDRRLTNSNSANDKSGYTVEFGERYLPKLELKKDVDAFGRPSYTWTYDKTEIGTYIDKDLLYSEYTTEVTGRDLYDLLGKSIIDDKDYTFTIAVDGEDRYNAAYGANGSPDVFNETYMKRDNKATLGRTGNGVLTQVFVDSDAKDVKIAVINTYLAKATSDYNDKKDSVSFDVYDLAGVTANSVDYYWKSDAEKDEDAFKILSVSGEDFAIEDVKEDDIYRVTVADGAIQTLDEIDVVSAVTLDSFKLNDNVVADGKQYDYADSARYDYEVLADWTGNNSASNLKDKTYNLYLDEYGYLIGVDLVEGVDNYVFITGIDSKNSNLSAKNYDANAIFLDGTMSTITFDNEKSDLTVGANPAIFNTWCTYTVNNKNIYTLTPVAGAATAGGSYTDSTGATVNYGVGDSLVGSGTGSNKIKVGQYWDKTSTTIDVKNVSLAGSAAATRQAYANVYGNDDTVYLNVELKGIDTDGQGNNYGVINKVANTVVGIKNASLDILPKGSSSSDSGSAWEQATDKGVAPSADTKLSYGTYVLYKDNGYVIAAVTVADDSESSKNLVYAHTSGLEIESYDKEADEWTWTRKVISNGDEITITEKGDGISELKKMNRYNWYEVAYNANGEVVDVAHAYDVLDKDGTTPDGKDDEYQDDITGLRDSINNGSDTILFEESTFMGYETSNCPDNGNADHDGDGTATVSATTPKLEGSLYYVRTTDTTGVYVDDSVKVIFIQTVDNKVTTSIDSGKSALKYVIDHLNANNSDNYFYETSMIIDRGFAKVVVVHDLVGSGSNGSHETPAGDITIEIANGVITVSEYDPDDMSQAEVLEEIVKELESQGYTDVEANFADGAIGEIKAKKGSITYTFDVVDEVIAAAAQDKVDAAKAALVDQDDIKAATGEAFADMDAAKAAAEEALTALVTGSGAQIDTSEGTDGFSWAAKTSGDDWANGTIGNATAEAGTAGTYPVTVYVKSGDVTDSKTVNVTLKPAAFKDTTAGKAGAQILTTAKAKVTGVQIAKGAAAYTQWSDVSAAVQTAVETKVNDSTNVVVTVAQNADDGGSVDNSAGTATVNVDVTLAYKTAAGTSTGVTETFTIAVTIEQHS